MAATSDLTFSDYRFLIEENCSVIAPDSEVRIVSQLDLSKNWHVHVLILDDHSEQRHTLFRESDKSLMTAIEALHLRSALAVDQCAGPDGLDVPAPKPGPMLPTRMAYITPTGARTSLSCFPRHPDGLLGKPPRRISSPSSSEDDMSDSEDDTGSVRGRPMHRRTHKASKPVTLTPPTSVDSIPHCDASSTAAATTGAPSTTGPAAAASAARPHNHISFEEGTPFRPSRRRSSPPPRYPPTAAGPGPTAGPPHPYRIPPPVSSMWTANTGASIPPPPPPGPRQVFPPPPRLAAGFPPAHHQPQASIPPPPGSPMRLHIVWAGHGSKKILAVSPGPLTEQSITQRALAEVRCRAQSFDNVGEVPSQRPGALRATLRRVTLDGEVYEMSAAGRTDELIRLVCREAAGATRMPLFEVEVTTVNMPPPPPPMPQRLEDDYDSDYLDVVDV